MINKVFLMGRVGQAPKMYDKFATFTLATNQSYKDSEGKWQERTDWHSILVNNPNLFKTVEKLDKGVKVYITGQLHTSEKDGKSRTSVVVNSRGELIVI